jgi:hypothetical protein
MNPAAADGGGRRGCGFSHSTTLQDDLAREQHAKFYATSGHCPHISPEDDGDPFPSYIPFSSSRMHLCQLTKFCMGVFRAAWQRLSNFSSSDPSMAKHSKHCSSLEW